MSENDQESGAGFRIVDRRRFNPDGTKRDASEASEEQTARPSSTAASPPPAEPQETPSRSQRRSQPASDGSAHQPGSIDFVSFIASLATNAMAALGVLPAEMSGDLPVNPDLAREYIDILAMLQQKTQGNLSAQEDAALQRVLTDLRMAYVEVTRSGVGV